MITVEEIRAKAEPVYWRHLQSLVNGEMVFPWEVPFRKPNAARDDHADARDRTDALLASAKQQLGYGYALELVSINTRNWGPQRFPERITFADGDDLVRFLGRERQTEHFTADVGALMAQFPTLRDWAACHPREIVAHHGVWPELLKVCTYFVSNPRPRLFARELPIAVHTKFIEDHKPILTQLLAVLIGEFVDPAGKTFEQRHHLLTPEPDVRLRFLDPALQRRFGFPLSHVTIPLGDFSKLPLMIPRLLITEGKLTFLTLPPCANTLAVFGSGFAVANLRSNEWLSGARLFYWGDLDAHGFEILSQLRAFAKEATAIMMDQATFEEFGQFAGPGPQLLASELPYLTEQETQLFRHLNSKCRRLEQERITQAYAERVLRMHLPVPVIEP